MMILLGCLPISADFYAFFVHETIQRIAFMKKGLLLLCLLGWIYLISTQEKTIGISITRQFKLATPLDKNTKHDPYINDVCIQIYPNETMIQ